MARSRNRRTTGPERDDAKLDNVATGVENLTKTFTGDKIDNLLGPFTDFLKANREPLTASIANLQAISTQINERAGNGGQTDLR